MTEPNHTALKTKDSWGQKDVVETTETYYCFKDFTNIE